MESTGLEGRRGPRRTWTLWLAVAVLCGAIIGIHIADHLATAPPPDPAEASSPLLKLYGRVILGGRALDSRFGRGGGGAAAATTEPIIDALNTLAKNPVERLRATPLIAEAAGREAAIAHLDDFERATASDGPADAALRRDAAAFRAIYSADDPADALDAAQRDELIRRHGWFARLALSFGKPDADPARAGFAREGLRAMALMLLALAVFAAIGVAGLVLFVVAIALFASGQLVIRYPLTCAPPAGVPPPGPVYLETFVLFLALFVGVQAVAAIVAGMLPVNVSLVLMLFLPLAALWPMARGVGLREARRSLGLTGGRGVLVEMACGAAGHLAGTPIVLLGLLLSVIVIQLTHTDASHPITREVNTASPLNVAAMLFFAAVWAPLVEETFFRGALYHHIRRRLPAAPAALIVGLIFAAIHPQGIGGVPVLTALGANFCLMREWRGSLIAPMTAHALHNGVIVVFLVLFLM